MNYVIMSSEANNTGIIFGGILIISGIYQFTSLKNKCIGYCESPLSFFMRRWSNGVMGAIKMGAFHGLYCLGCCWPYFLIMVSLGWMSVTWMALFAAIIFGEKIWSRGIWIARSVGIILILLGILSSLGVVTIYDNMTEMNLNAAEKMVM
jgi:predicted metal-binding membrane protein